MIHSEKLIEFLSRHASRDITTKPQVEISIEAKEAARFLALPSHKTIFEQNDDTWIHAFAWYNRYVNKAIPKRMVCRPCWATVYNALKQAKA